MDIAALALAANAIVVPVERLAGGYAAAVTAILIGAGMLFLFAFVRFYDALVTSSRNRKSAHSPFAAKRHVAVAASLGKWTNPGHARQANT